ncbi:hypothetical protein BBP12_11075 [Limosilactobacillus reuteri]|nr:hypothetical protein BBP12_11075 [Limosilactobacillus reuteri]
MCVRQKKFNVTIFPFFPLVVQGKKNIFYIKYMGERKRRKIKKKPNKKKEKKKKIKKKKKKKKKKNKNKKNT